MVTSSDAGTATTLRQSARSAVRTALARAVDSGRLPDSPEARAVDVDVTRPANPEHGDAASNVALRLAKPMRLAPPAIAAALVAELQSGAAGAEAIERAGAIGAGGVIARAEAAGPGFVNLHYADSALESMLDRARRRPAQWGRVADGGDGQPGRSVNVEFVSANPTGPLTVGNARGAFVGDLLSRVLEAGGQRVTREYYFNDSGAQVRKLGASILAIREGREVPEDGYHGQYVVELAPELPDDVVRAGADEDERAWAAGRWASDRIREGIESSLARLGVRFDVWTTEGRLRENGWVDRAIERLREGGHLYEQDGATWFRSTAFGDDKDRVVIRSDGNLTYFAFDIGYVTEKFSRGYDHLIYIWGADHHGTVARNRNAAEAMGFDKAAVEMILTGWVHFLVDGEPLAMSKRAGTFITLDDLLAELGVDAARWYFASRGANLDINVDIEEARKLRTALEQGDYDEARKSPVFYVQYAHARIASILRKAAAVGIPPAPALEGSGLLRGGPEGTLARIVVRLPEVIEDAVAAQETQGVTTYATELATAFHAFYRDARVVDPEAPELSAQRLALVDATRISLANALGLLGISAPESM